MSNNQTLQTWADNYWKTIYPVGAIYQSMSTTSPASLFGGSWNPINGVFLLSNSDSYQNDDTGGEESHTLQESEIPSITGEVLFNQWITIRNTEQDIIQSATGCFSKSPPDYHQLQQTAANVPFVTSCRAFQFNFGEDQSHNNMPPYLVCSMWRRVS